MASRLAAYLIMYILKTWLLLSRAILAALLQDIFLFAR